MLQIANADFFNLLHQSLRLTIVIVKIYHFLYKLGQ